MAGPRTVKRRESITRLRSFVACTFVAVATAAGCGSDAPRGSPGASSLVRIDRTRCIPSRRLGVPRELVALLCAEAFVARNGYTDAPATGDTTQLAFESIEASQSAAQLLADRRNTLESRAYGLCPLGAAGPGLAVIFRYRADTLRPIGRAVTMTADLDSLRVQHRDFILANVADSGTACVRLVSARGRIREPRPPSSKAR
jgi:hypothetical protein